MDRSQRRCDSGCTPTTPSFIERAEIRVFDHAQSLQAAPLAIVAVDGAGLAEWQPAAEHLGGPAHELKYVLRAYDAKGNFDETEAQPLWLFHETALLLPSLPSRRHRRRMSTSQRQRRRHLPRELLAAYGESELAQHNIPLGSGTVKVQGSGIPANHTVWVAGRQVPVDSRATSPRRRSFRPAHTRSKSPCSTMRATVRSICATWSSSATTCSTSALPT